MAKRKVEKSIMPESELYEIERTEYNVRHEVFFGTANRKKSVEDGLFIFLSPEMHNMSDLAIHFDKNFQLAVKKIGQKAWMDHYGKKIKDFRLRYGRNYLEGGTK